MQVFKFGGASVRNAAGVRNLHKILGSGFKDPLLVVVSAMGKTTNCLENILRAENPEQRTSELNLYFTFHDSIIRELLPEDDTLKNELLKSIAFIEQHLLLDLSAGEKYDAIVSQGELLSTKIISRFLETSGMNVRWEDAREHIITDAHYTEGHVDWEVSGERIGKLNELLKHQIVITQGFIAGTADGMTTTLGREGSDYSAAIFATCLGAKSVTVWKDVNGIMNGDPKRISDTVKYEELPYTEAAEMTYYGATVIHPKTIKPLANCHIPLHVKSFFHPDETGTIIHDCSVTGLVPAVIIKDDQCLVSFHVRDFTFINERNVSLIYHELSEAGLKINLMQNSAISLSLIMDYHPDHLTHLMERLQPHFSIKYNTGLELLTIKNYTKTYIERFRSGREILLEQISRNNYRAVMVPISGRDAQ